MLFQSEELGTKVFQTNWIALNPKSNKSILMTLHRSSKPVIISSGFFIVLSLESFTKVCYVEFAVQILHFCLIYNFFSDTETFIFSF